MVVLKTVPTNCVFLMSEMAFDRGRVGETVFSHSHLQTGTDLETEKSGLPIKSIGRTYERTQ